MLATRAAIEAAAEEVYRVFSPTPQIRWPLLCERSGFDLVVKHENHLPTGAFKVRGGAVYLASIAGEAAGGVVAATRGNHGQSIAYAATRWGIPATIVVPRGNSPAKNRAMTAFGATLVEHGRDFQDALEHAQELGEGGLHLIPSFHPKLVEGVATYGLELFAAHPDLTKVYVPIGLGSGICAVLAARDAQGARAEIIGVVAENAPAYAMSMDTGRPVATDPPETFADGLAVRQPHPEAFEIIRRHVDHIVRVSEAEMRNAVRAYLHDTHNLAEGAGAAPLAAALQERDHNRGQRVAVVLSGSNLDGAVLQEILAEAGR